MFTSSAKLDLCAEMHVGIALVCEGTKDVFGKVRPQAASRRSSRHAWQKSGFPAPSEKPLDRPFVEHVTKVVSGNVGVGSRAMPRQSLLVNETLGLAQVTKHLIREVAGSAAGAHANRDAPKTAAHAPLTKAPLVISCYVTEALETFGS